MRALVLVAAAIAMTAIGCHSTTSTTPPPATATAPLVRAIDRDAIGALEDMGAFLRAQKQFTVEGDVTTDEILDSGQKVQLTSHTKIEVRRPDRLHAISTSDRKERELFYDGSNFTINSPRTGYYSTVDAPGTIAELVDFVDEQFEIQLPLADLFCGGTPSASTDMIYSAIDVGPATIDGVETDQFAFRQPGLDWQIWIESGERPLPRKLVLTTTDEPQELHVATLEWDLDAKHAAGTFRLTAPVIGATVYSLPPSCVAVVRDRVTYQQCGSTWYQPQYAGTQVRYVVVNAP